jgi:hypothetical protein
MASSLSLHGSPNPTRDVILQYDRARDARNGCPYPRWTLWLGVTPLREYKTEAAALRAARGLADQQQRPAWLVRPYAPPQALV